MGSGELSEATRLRGVKSISDGPEMVDILDSGSRFNEEVQGIELDVAMLRLTLQSSLSSSQTHGETVRERRSTYSDHYSRSRFWLAWILHARRAIRWGLASVILLVVES